MNFLYVQIAFALLILFAQVCLGLRMRKYGSAKVMIKTPMTASVLGLIFAGLIIAFGNWEGMVPILVALVAGPWLSPLVACLPSLKRLRNATNQRYRFAQDAVVVIECGHAHGNGFFVSEDTIVTSLHILTADFGGRLWAHTNNGRVELDLEQVDPSVDLLLLKVKQKGRRAHGVLRLAADTTTIGEGGALVLTTYCQPQRLRPRWCEATGRLLFRGPFSSFGKDRDSTPTRTNEDEIVLVVELPLEPGNSGSPVLNDRDEVVGVAAAGKENEGILVPVELVHRLLSTSPRG